MTTDSTPADLSPIASVEEILVRTICALEAHLAEASADRVVQIAATIGSLALDLHAVRSGR